jgi:hypothetical protein
MIRCSWHALEKGRQKHTADTHLPRQVSKQVSDGIGGFFYAQTIQ